MAEPIPFPAGGKEAIAAAIEQAAVVPPAPVRAADDGDGDHYGGGDDRGLPASSPVVALGRDGQTNFFLDAQQHFVALGAQQHGRSQILQMFGTSTQWLRDQCPWYDDEGKLKVDKWRAERAQEMLMISAARAGFWNPVERVRGPGAWRGENGELILHCGDELLVGARWQAPGRIGRYVYPADDPIPRPSEIYAPAGPTGPGATLLALLASWSWRRPEVDPVLLFGWIVAAMAGAAPRWRTPVWLTGDSATGKSTLHELVKLVLDSGLLAANDASQAGITQLVKQSSLAVAVDELEPGADPRKVQNIVQLARLAASGGQMLRGGADHVGRQFRIQMPLMFSSILVSPLPRQDRNRIVILDLAPLKGASPPAMEPRKLRELGMRLKRRLVDQWPRFDATLAAYRQVIAEALGREDAGRIADQFGTLLAFYDLAMADSVPEHAAIEVWAERILPSLDAVRAEDVADHDRLIAHLLTYVVDPWHNGTRKSLAEWALEARAELARGEKTLAANALQRYGLRLVVEMVPAQDDGPDPPGRAVERWWLYVANQHHELRHIFSDTHWQTPASATGVWVQSLQRYPGAEIARGPLRIGGVQTRCVRVPLDAVLPQGDA